MANSRLRVPTAGKQAFAADFAPSPVIGNVLSVVAGAPGEPLDVAWGAGGGGAALAQLTNTRWVDKATTVPLANQTGTVGAPFASIAQARTALLATGGTILLVPADYSTEGTTTFDGLNPFSFINVAGLQMVPPDNTPLVPCFLPTLNGTASKYVQGCSCLSLISTAAHIEAVACEIHTQAQAFANLRCLDCSFTRDAGLGPLITAGVMNLQSCHVRGNGDLATLAAGTHSIVNCTFGAGTGLIDGPNPGIVVQLDTFSNYNYNLAFGAAFGANANPQINSLRDIRIGTGVVPALAAAALDYLNVDVSVVGLPAIATGTPVTVNMNADMHAAGAGAGFMPYARTSAPDTVRMTFVGTLVGGAQTFVFCFG